MQQNQVYGDYGENDGRIVSLPELIVFGDLFADIVVIDNHRQNGVIVAAIDKLLYIKELFVEFIATDFEVVEYQVQKRNTYIELEDQLVATDEHRAGGRQ